VSPYLQASPTWRPAASLALDRLRPGAVDRWLVGARKAATLAALLGLLWFLRHDRTERNAGMHGVPPRRIGRVGYRSELRVVLVVVAVAQRRPCVKPVGR
jgi:hypothetical protein